MKWQYDCDCVFYHFLNRWLTLTFKNQNIKICLQEYPNDFRPYLAESFPKVSFRACKDNLYSSLTGFQWNGKWEQAAKFEDSNGFLDFVEFLLLVNKLTVLYALRLLSDCKIITCFLHFPLLSYLVQFLSD